MAVPTSALRTIAALCLLAPATAAASPGCPPDDWTVDRLRALKASEFVVEENDSRQKLALALLACLSDADPVLRDGVAFEAYATWGRGGKLDQKTLLASVEQLQSALRPEGADESGFRQPFAALVLAELARADRKAPYLTPEQRQQLVDSGSRYLETLRDYRGFDSQEGWRHGVAHTSDLLMQLALNEALDKAQLDRMLGAIKQQIAPAGEHFYIYGEPERLARPVLFAAMRGLHSPEEWKAWFQQVASPAPLSAWEQAYQSNAGLAKRHNTHAFLLGVYGEVRDSKNEQLAKLLPAVTAAMASMK